MACSTCHGAPVRAVRRGHDVVFRACDLADAEPSCPDCGDEWAPELVCDGCEGKLPETPFTLGTDVYCDACALALTAEVVTGGPMAEVRS